MIGTASPRLAGGQQAGDGQGLLTCAGGGCGLRAAHPAGRPRAVLLLVSNKTDLDVTFGRNIGSLPLVPSRSTESIFRSINERKCFEVSGTYVFFPSSVFIISLSLLFLLHFFPPARENLFWLQSNLIFAQESPSRYLTLHFASLYFLGSCVLNTARSLFSIVICASDFPLPQEKSDQYNFD